MRPETLDTDAAAVRRGRLSTWIPVAVVAVVQLWIAAVLARESGAPLAVDVARLVLAPVTALALAFRRSHPRAVVLLLGVVVLADFAAWLPAVTPLGRDEIDLAAVRWASRHDLPEQWRGPWTAWASSSAPRLVAPLLPAFLVAIASASLRGLRAWPMGAAAVVWLGVVAGGSLAGLDVTIPRAVGLTVLLAAALLVGTAAHARGAARRARVEAAVAQRERAARDERTRIARELHDVLGHSLSQISVQAGVGLHLLDRDVEQARSALASIRELSRGGLDEVRGVLGILRSDETGGDAALAPQPGIARIRELAQRAGADAGGGAVGPVGASGPLAVTVEIDPRALEHEPPAHVDLAAYRIVQEALTNVERHARASSARATVAIVGAALVVTIDDDGQGLRGREPGNGILGMRERAAALGGGLEVGRSPRGGVRVRAVLPWPGAPGSGGAARADAGATPGPNPVAPAATDPRERGDPA